MAFGKGLIGATALTYIGMAVSYHKEESADIGIRD
jgi:hypothetical protein